MKEESSFSEEAKRPLFIEFGARTVAAPNKQKFFASFFQKRSASFLLLTSNTEASRQSALSRLLALPPETIALRHESGRPVLDRPAGALCSFARCGDRLLVGAVRRGRFLGVDLERVRADLPLLEVAEALFAPPEARALRGLPEPERALCFTALWTVKEAALKASGRGIVDGLARLRLEVASLWPALRGRGEARVLLGLRGRALLRVLRLPEGTLVACAVRG